MSAKLENLAVATGMEKFNFHFNTKGRQCQGMFKRPHDQSHFTYQQGNAQNTLSYASTVCDSLIPGVQARLADEQDTNLSTSTR